MIVITIGTERKLFSENPTRDRIVRAVSGFEKYHAIIFTLARDNFHHQEMGNVIAYPTNSSSKIFYVWDALKIGIRIAKQLSQEDKKKAVLSVQDPFECGIVGLIISKWCDIALHVQVHVDLYAKYFHNTLLQRIRSMAAPFVLRGAHGIRCVSMRIKRGIEQRGLSSAPIQVLPIFIDVTKYDHAKPVTTDVHDLFPEKRFVILMASRLEAEKDIALAINTVTTVAKKNPHKIGLVIVGSGACEAELKKQVARLGIEGDVKFVAWTNDLYSYYRSADLFMLTSLFEGYALTIPEALLCGTPVLTSDVGVAPEVIFQGKTGWICPCRGQACFERVLGQMIDDPAMYQQTKDYLTEHPYVHTYADRAEYDKVLKDNTADALHYKYAN